MFWSLFLWGVDLSDFEVSFCSLALVLMLEAVLVILAFDFEAVFVDVVDYCFSGYFLPFEAAARELRLCPDDLFDTEFCFLAAFACVFFSSSAMTCLHVRQK